MSARTWYRLPWPLAVALVVLMPWRAVAALRTADRANVELLGYIVAQYRAYGRSTERGRHLRLLR